jgi:cysteinyl-tRNA synthetase
MHNGLVRVDHEKMSKSVGNFFTLRDIFVHHDPMVLRFDFINHYYRAPLEFSLSALSSIKKSYQRLCRIFYTCEGRNRVLTKVNIQSDVVKKMLAYLLDDFNTPGMLGVLFESLDSLKEDEEALYETKLFVQQVLGLTLQKLPEKEVVLTPEIKELLREREKARTNKDWTRADEIRDQLLLIGVQVHDKKIGNK